MSYFILLTEALPKKVAWKIYVSSLCPLLQRVVERLRDSLEIEYQEASC